MSKKTKPVPPAKVYHDFSVNKSFRGSLIAENPEDFEFETEDGKEVFVKKIPALVKAMQTPINGVPLAELEGIIEVTYLGDTTRDGEPWQKFKVEFEPDESED